MYNWSDDNFPPHCVPDKTSDLLKIFNGRGVIQMQELLKKLVPGKICSQTWEDGREKVGILCMPYVGTTIKHLNNTPDRKSGTGVMEGRNIGDWPDWYSDARFAQQQFTGTNPSTIRLASHEWLSIFVDVAEKQNNQEAVDLFHSAGPESFYVQDYSYFRDAVKAKADYVMMAEGLEGNRWSCAAVSLFQLHSDGRLHPLAIVIDYKDSIDTP